MEITTCVYTIGGSEEQVVEHQSGEGGETLAVTSDNFKGLALSDNTRMVHEFEGSFWNILYVLCQNFVAIGVIH